jgi:hypothetical protein
LPIHVLKYTNGHKSPKKQGFDARLNLPNFFSLSSTSFGSHPAYHFKIAKKPLL